jgi:hypothetical protein
MQLKNQLTERRSAEVLRASAQELYNSGYQTMADIMWQEAELQEKRERKRHAKHVSVSSDEYSDFVDEE